MTRVRLLVSDIDGTLVAKDKSLSDGNVAAMARAVAAGLRVSLISARPPSGMTWIADRLGLDGPLAAFNGATLFKRDGTILSAERLTRDAATRALALIDRPGVSPWLFADGEWHVRDLATPHIPHEVKAAGVEPVVGDDWAALLGRADKIVGVCDDPDLLIGIESDVQAAIGDQATVVRSQTYYLDVLSPAGNKGDGLRALAADFGVALDEIAALGDQNNDLPMFALAGLSVAMGQGPANVRDAAKHVAASNDDDGVADAIDRFVLPAA